MRVRAGWFFLLALMACSRAQEPAAARPEASASSTAQSPSETYELADNYKGSPCIPKGPAVTLRGHVRVEPFGKGTDGARLIDSEGRRWVLTYGAEGILAGLHGALVEARGRECDKQFEAIGGLHFDLSSVTVLARDSSDGGSPR